MKKAAKMDAASKFRSMQANARVIKHYRSKMTTSEEVKKFLYEEGSFVIAFRTVVVTEAGFAKARNNVEKF